MQQVKSDTSAPASVVAGGIGGIVLLVGSFLTWATVSLNVAKFAQLLHVPEASIAAAGASASVNVAGTKADGKYTLVLGIVVIVGAIIAFTQAGGRKIGGIIMAAGGLIGALIPVIEILTKNSQINSAISDSSAALSQVGISSDVFKSLFTISWGIGLWGCLLGGIVALVAGVMTLMAAGGATSVATDMGGMPPATPMGGDMGFGAPAASPMEPPPMAAPMPTPTEASPPPPSMPMPTPTEPPTAPDDGSGESAAEDSPPP